jgi:hypothetical protein
VYAFRNPIGTNLDRVQVIKGWMDAGGILHENTYDIAVSDGCTNGADRRCKTPVGNTVDLSIYRTDDGLCGIGRGGPVSATRPTTEGMRK